MGMASIHTYGVAAVSVQVSTSMLLDAQEEEEPEEASLGQPNITTVPFTNTFFTPQQTFAKILPTYAYWRYSKSY